MKGAVVVCQDRMGMSQIAKLPIKAGMNSSERRKCKGIMGFKRGFKNDVSVSDKGSGVSSGGAV